MPRPVIPDDLWELIEPIFPPDKPPKSNGRPTIPSPTAELCGKWAFGPNLPNAAPHTAVPGQNALGRRAHPGVAAQLPEIARAL